MSVKEPLYGRLRRHGRRGEGAQDAVRQHALRPARRRGAREYTTFREQIARDAVVAEGRRARTTFHEQQRGNFTNVYLDAVEPLEEPAAEDGSSEAVEEVAWKTAVDAAPWLLGGEPDEAVPPGELFERLQPFKERVADDIRGEPSDEPDD